MPRQNPGRSIDAEAILARRIAWERDQRGWTNEGLAKRLTNVGCAVHHTAIYKIEKGNPRRRISVNELVAFAQVFEMDVEDLLLPVEIATRPHATEEFKALKTAVEQSERTVNDLEEARDRFLQMLTKYPESAGGSDDLDAWLTLTYASALDEDLGQKASLRYLVDRVQTNRQKLGSDEPDKGK